MVPLLKVAAVGGVCAGALYCTWWISSASGDIPFRDLSTDEDFDTASGKAYNNKYASDYSKYFVGVHENAKSDSPFKDISNKDWWNWSFENRYKTSENSFKKQGFQSKNSADDLKGACKSAYQAATNKVKTGATATDEHEESNVWAFCSIGGNKPTTISDRTGEKDSYGTGKYGGEEANAKLLISVTDEKNNWFWDVKEKEFNEMTEYPSDLGETSTTSKFKEEHTKRKQNTSSKKIKELCKDAYSAAPATNNDFPKKAVFKFCSLSGKEPATTVPGG